jgi:long-chain acyl-CoA synthetase
MLTYDNVIDQAAANGDSTMEGLSDRRGSVAYLPLAWVGDHIFSYAQAIVAGFCVNCPESPRR